MFIGKDETVPFSISAVEDYPTMRIVRLRGSLDQTTVSELERFRKWVANHRGFKHKNVLLDFKNVTHADTAAVAEVVQAVAELKTAHFRLGAIHLSEEVRGMFQVLQVEKWIDVYDNESKALEAFNRKTS
jgi:anti-anti-sigma factor